MSKVRIRKIALSIINIKSSNNLLLIIYLPVLIITFLKVYSDVFDEKISLAGDNAGYYILGTSIATGQGYTNIQTIEKSSHNHFPPGYPLIIAAASKVYSDDISFIKKVNGFFLLLSIGLLFFIVYSVSGNYHVAFISCLFLLFNYHLLTYSMIMMSEVPFMFFSLLSLFLLMKINFSLPVYKNWLFLLLIICIAFAYHIRSAGLALIAGVALFLAFDKKWKYLASLFIGFIAMALPWYLRNQSLGGNAYMKQLFLKNPYRPELGQMELFDWLIRFWSNLERYIAREIPSGTFNFIEVVSNKIPITALEWIIGSGCILFMLFGLFKIKKFFSVLLFYILGMFAIVLLWPDVWFGVRFLIPLIPLLTFLFIFGAFELLNLIGQKVLKVKNQSIIYLSIVILSVIATGIYSRSLIKLEKKSDEIFPNNYINYFELANLVNQKTPDTSVTCCRKPQLFYLHSRKYVTGIRTTINQEEQIEFLIDKGVDYVVLDRLGYASTERNLYPAVIRYPNKFQLIGLLNDPDTRLLKFVPELGYWGDWKDNKRNGRGTFAWEDGMKFEGEFRDGQRNGKGTLFLVNGRQADGVWTNDTLNGEVFIRSKDGDTIEHSFYLKNVRVGVVFLNK